MYAYLLLKVLILHALACNIPTGHNYLIIKKKKKGLFLNILVEKGSEPNPPNCTTDGVVFDILSVKEKGKWDDVTYSRNLY